MGNLQRIAVADLGTNTFNLIIAEKRPQGGFSVLGKETRESRLGRNNGLNGTISPDALNDAIQLMQVYDVLATQFSVDLRIAIGTSALRQASNATSFKIQLEKETGFKLQVIAGSEEAFLIHQGIVASGCMEIKRLILDIGGGSCEFIIAEKEEVFWKKSFEIGMVRASALALTNEDFQANRTEKLRNYFLPALNEVKEAIEQYRPSDLIGAAGSFDTLAAIHAHQHKIAFNPDYAFTPINQSDLEVISNRIIGDSLEARLKYPEMIAVRASLLPYALYLIKETMLLFPQESMLICTNNALREGVAKLVFENNWH